MPNFRITANDKRPARSVVSMGDPVPGSIIPGISSPEAIAAHNAAIKLRVERASRADLYKGVRIENVRDDDSD